MTRQKLLIIRLRSIGDLVLTTPALEQIHKHYPDISIQYLAEEGIGDVLSTNEHIDNLILVKKGFIAQIKLLYFLLKTPFYMTVNLHGGPRSVFLTIISLAKKRVGEKTSSPLCALYTQVVKHIGSVKNTSHKYHSVENTMCLFEQAGFLMGDRLQWKQRLPLTNEMLAGAQKQLDNLGIKGGSSFIVMHAVVRGKNEWGLDKKRLLCDRLFSEGGISTLLLGGANDVAYLSQVKEGRGHVTILAGETSLMQSAAIMKISRGFVGLDSGPAHMAAALNIPVAVLFGTTNSTLWRPWGDTVRVFEKKNKTPLENAPHDKTGGLSSISVDEVYQWFSTNVVAIKE